MDEDASANAVGVGAHDPPEGQSQGPSAVATYVYVQPVRCLVVHEIAAVPVGAWVYGSDQWFRIQTFCLLHVFHPSPWSFWRSDHVIVHVLDR